MIRKNKSNGQGFQRYFVLSGCFFLFVLFLLIAILCLVPPISRDALVHHLTIPKIYLSYGKIVELPCMVYSYFPMNLDILYGLCLYLGSDIVPKLVHFFFGVLTAALIYKYLQKRLSGIYALSGVICFFTIPIIIKLSITVYVDLGLVFFSTAALLSLFEWKDSNFKHWRLVVPGILCGLAMGTKYNGFITFMLLIGSIFYFFCTAREKKKPIPRVLIGLVLFTLTSLAIYSPWGIRNYIWTGNPVYPLYNSVFNIDDENKCINSLELENWGNEKLSSVDFRRLLYSESWLSIILLPIRIFFEGKDNDFQRFDGEMTPVLFFLPMFSFICMGKNRKDRNHEKIVLLGYSIFFILIALATTAARIRYFAPAIPPLVILSIFGVHGIVCFINENTVNCFRKKFGVVFLLFVSIFQILNGMSYMIKQYEYVHPFPYLMGKINKKDYISSYRSEIFAFEYINQHLKSDAKILFVYIGKRGYYCEREYIPDNGNNLRLLYVLSQENKSSSKIVLEIKRMGITHLFINNALVKQQIKNDLSKEEANVLYNFINQYTELIFNEKGFAVYEIKI